MGQIWTDILLGTLLSLFIVIWSIYHYFTKNYEYWKKRGVPHRKAAFPYGSMKGLFTKKTPMGVAYDQVYREFSGERFCGVLESHHPVLVIRDPDLIKHMLIKDFSHFVDRAAVEVNPREEVANHLFSMNEECWREMRYKLTPVFTSGKIKNMFLLMAKCGDQLTDCLQKSSETGKSIDVKEISAKFNMDIIATCAFGLETNSLINENTDFYKAGISIISPPLRVAIRRIFFDLFPALGRILNIRRIGRKATNLVYSMVSNTVKYREGNNVSRNDFLDILISMKLNKSILDENEGGKEPGSISAKVTPGITLDQMAAQSLIFFIAGFETSSSTMTFCLYELALHQEIQERLWREVEEVLHRYEDKITYQALQEMTYMDQVVNEVLRLYPSLAVLHRQCTQNYRIPNSTLVLEKGLKIRIPVYGIHRDPQYYTDPLKFDPERFTPENIKSRHPCVHLPFGTGPRNCIGMRFGLLQTKLGVATFISNFRVETTPDTTIPIELNPLAFVSVPKKPVFLKVIKR